MALVSLNRVSLAYGHWPLLDLVDFGIEPGERVCVVGRNGTGKSSLLKVVSGEIVPDDGQIVRADALRVGVLAQEVPLDERRTPFEIVTEGLGELGPVVAEYHRVAAEVASGNEGLERLAALQQQLEARDGWRMEQRVEALLSRLGLPFDRPLAELSGGIKRRVLLARALANDPDLLLLDEPTNHLDVTAIAWLEEFLKEFPGSVLFVTHDRAFLQGVATRIVELDRGHLTSFPGNYSLYLERKEQMLAAEEQENARFDKKLAQEEVWIRQGIKARRTRNEGRVRALEAMREERRRRRERQGAVSMAVETGTPSGHLVVECEGASTSYGDRTIVRGLTTRIVRGDRVGIIGPNGVGKSTLIKLLLGLLPPASGSVRLGSNLQVAYFDQQREGLDPERNVIDNLDHGKEMVMVAGQQRHVVSYLQDFLFDPARLRSPVKSLSGGERNRLLLARLFLRPANLLVMDEPTNDLDVETLELLEELLLQYDGTLLLVSHDRTFLDNVVTSTLVFEGEGEVNEYVGGYAEWLRQRRPPVEAVKAPEPPRPRVTESERQPRPKARKLGFKEQRELEALPGRIEAMEAELAALHGAMADPAFYRQGAQPVAEATGRIAALDEALLEAYARWEELEAVANGGA